MEWVPLGLWELRPLNENPATASGHRLSYVVKGLSKTEEVISVSTYDSLRSTEGAPTPTIGYLRLKQRHVRPKQATLKPTKGPLGPTQNPLRPT